PRGATQKKGGSARTRPSSFLLRPATERRLLARAARHVAAVARRIGARVLVRHARGRGAEEAAARARRIGAIALVLIGQALDALLGAATAVVRRIGRRIDVGDARLACARQTAAAVRRVGCGALVAVSGGLCFI